MLRVCGPPAKSPRVSHPAHRAVRSIRASICASVTDSPMVRRTCSPRTIQTPDHTPFQTAAGICVRAALSSSIRSTSSRRCPASRTVSVMTWGRASAQALAEQLHVCDCHLIRHIFIPIFHRLGRTAQIFSRPIFPPKAGRAVLPPALPNIALHLALPQFFGDAASVSGG